MSLLSVVVDLYGVFKVLVPRLNHRLGLSGAGVVVVRLQAKLCLENCVFAPWNFRVFCGLPSAVRPQGARQNLSHFDLSHPRPFSKFFQFHHLVTPPFWQKLSI